MWHRLDRILGGRGRGGQETAARCDACGGPLWPDPALVIDVAPSEERRRVCCPECLPAIWKKVEGGRQKLSKPRFHPVQTNVTLAGRLPTKD
jgi:hypothetical protein